MIQAICSILTIFQVIDVAIAILAKKTRRSVQFSFIVWHLSLVMFAINGTSLWISLLHVINCAFIFYSLNKVRVVTIIGIGEEIKDYMDPYLDSQSIDSRLSELLAADGCLVQGRQHSLLDCPAGGVPRTCCSTAHETQTTPCCVNGYAFDISD